MFCCLIRIWSVSQKIGSDLPIWEEELYWQIFLLWIKISHVFLFPDVVIVQSFVEVLYGFYLCFCKQSPYEMIQALPLVEMKSGGFCNYYIHAMNSEHSNFQLIAETISRNFLIYLHCFYFWCAFACTMQKFYIRVFFSTNSHCLWKCFFCFICSFAHIHPWGSISPLYGLFRSLDISWELLLE